MYIFQTIRMSAKINNPLLPVLNTIRTNSTYQNAELGFHCWLEFPETLLIHTKKETSNSMLILIQNACTVSVTFDSICVCSIVFPVT